MRMAFSIPVSKPRPQSQPQLQIQRTNYPNTKQNINNDSLVISNSFTNIFARLQTTGRCGSCGH
jgi:hypothetical protein